MLELSAKQIVGAVAFCLLLTIVHTWPLAGAPGTLSRNDNADNQLNEWIIAWVAHQLPSDPLHLYDANIFYPEPRTLAFSEPLIVPALMVAPVLWVGFSPVLAHNLALMLGMVLTAAAGYLLVVRFTGYHLGGLLAASLVAFNALTLTSMPQIQIHHGYGVILAILGFDLMLAEPLRYRGPALLGGSLLMLALTSGYMTVLGLTAVGVTALVRARELLAEPARPALKALGVAALVTAALVGVLLAPYWLAHTEQGLTRVPNTPASSILASYFSSGARIHFTTWVQLVSGARAFLFPGFVPLGLALVAVIGMAGKRERRRMYALAAVGAVGVFFSFGSSNPVYMALYRMLPPLQGLRIVARFGLLLLMMVGVLAGCGLFVLQKRYGERRWFPVVALGLLLVVNLEVLRAPMRYVPFEGISPVYDAVAAQSDARVLAEFPFYPARIANGNAAYMLGSTRHWKPLLNGYSGMVPQSYRRRAEILARFPQRPAIAELQRAGVTHIIVHTDDWGRGATVVERLRGRADFALLADDGSSFLFALR